MRWLLHTPVGLWDVNSPLDNREMGGPVYWEGLSNLLDGQERRVGCGYLEMTAYAAPLQL